MAHSDESSKSWSKPKMQPCSLVLQPTSGYSILLFKQEVQNQTEKVNVKGTSFLSRCQGQDTEVVGGKQS